MHTIPPNDRNRYDYTPYFMFDSYKLTSKRKKQKKLYQFVDAI